MHSKYFQIFIFLITCTKFSLSGINRKFDSSELDRRLKALQRVVDFMAHRPEQINIDATFGLTLAQAQLMGTLYHHNVQFLTREQQNNLTTLVQICDDLRRHVRKTLVIKQDAVFLINKYLTKPERWVYPIFWKKGFLGQTVPGKENYTYEEVSKLLHHGRPAGSESDNCIKYTLKGISKGNCKISNECEMMLNEDDDPRGYSTTHRLLLVLISKRFNCKELNTITHDKLISRYCSLILQNLVDVKDIKSDAPIKDIVLEEVLLCGLEGYTEFVNDYYSELILSWQEPEGCFQSYLMKNKTNVRRKRNWHTIDFGCEDHVTGLGAATIALFVREYIENAIFDNKN